MEFETILLIIIFSLILLTALIMTSSLIFNIRSYEQKISPIENNNKELEDESIDYSTCNL